MLNCPYPLPALRAVALHAQRLTAPNGAESPPTLDALDEVVELLSCIQIDTLHLVARSQYLVMWSRLGTYDPADFDRLLFEPGRRRLFEYWGHAASIIPLDAYRYHVPYMQHFEMSPGRWWERWLTAEANREIVHLVLERIRAEGALRAADFQHDGPKRGSWWDWKPAKFALEYLFATGVLMVSNRVNFQRVYDLRERVLPAWVDQVGVTKDDAKRHSLEQGVKALGVCRLAQAAEYAYMRRGDARPYLEVLVREGVIVEVEGTLHDGSTATLVVHRDHLPLLDQAADGIIRPARTTFLSPFDSLFWARGRDEDLWGFQQVLEAYKREPDRRWGYFCLPILHHDRLVGRFDPKLERKNGLLRLRALYLEPGIEPDETLVADVAAALRDFLRFHKAGEVVIERSDPPEFGERLARAL